MNRVCVRNRHPRWRLNAVELRRIAVAALDEIRAAPARGDGRGGRAPVSGQRTPDGGAIPSVPDAPSGPALPGEVGIHLVDARRMAELNEVHLKHHGPTDVITFDYASGGWGQALPVTGVEERGATVRSSKPPSIAVAPTSARIECGGTKVRQGDASACPTATESWLHGDIVVCLDVARSQARTFRSSWLAEVVRYVVHGLLHLHGFDDLEPAARKRMKREEDRVVRRLASRFDFSRLHRSGTVRL